MFITKKRFNQILEDRLDEQKRKYEKELLDKDRQISILETQLAMKELLIQFSGVREQIEGVNYGTK